MVMFDSEAWTNKYDDAITQYLKDHPSTAYEPVMELDLSPDPIVTIRSQPLPDFSLSESLDNIHVRIADFGSGEWNITSRSFATAKIRVKLSQRKALSLEWMSSLQLYALLKSFWAILGLRPLIYGVLAAWYVT